MENLPDDKFAFHGSPIKFDSDHAIPRLNTRIRTDESGQEKVIFEEESFHATPYKWIALAYTYSPKPFEIDGKTSHYNMGVSLYENNMTVCVLGFGSLEKSLEELYGDGGYLYHFDKDEFIYKEGLGNLEVIVSKPTKPVTVERIENPVEEMRKLGVKFTFVDLSLPKYEGMRHYKN